MTAIPGAVFAAELERRLAVAMKRNEKLLDFIPRVSPRYVSPRHLAPLANLFERAKRERVLAVVSAPPRHGKTELELHAIAWALAHDPAKQIAFIGYAGRFAEKKSRKARELARKAGVPMASDSASRQDWRTSVADGGLWATSIGGQITGEGFHLMVVDDPVKDRKTAESPTYREDHYEWFNDVAYTRLEPTGSCIVTQTRWHSDDLAGRLIADGWECISLPAIDDAGAALWPERFSLEQLRDIEGQLGDYGWSSLYQGRPRPRGGAVFQDVHFIHEVPKLRVRYSIGVDFAYTAKTHADYSAAVVMAEAGGIFYVLEVVRQQVTAPQFGAALRALITKYPGARVGSFVGGGTDRVVVDFLCSIGIRVEGWPAIADKFTRAQAYAAAWNAQKVLLVDPGLQTNPRGPTPGWVEPFVGEHASFTGVKDPTDDQVDAGAAAHHALAEATAIAPILAPKRQSVAGAYRLPGSQRGYG